MRMTTEQRDKLKADLAEVTEKLRVGVPHYIELAKEIIARRLAKENLSGRVKNADERISAHYDRRPRAFDFLPEDPECVAWSQEYDRLQAERQQLVDEIRVINPEERTQEAIALEPPYGLIGQWEMAKGNIAAALERDADEGRNAWESRRNRPGALDCAVGAWTTAHGAARWLLQLLSGGVVNKEDPWHCLHRSTFSTSPPPASARCSSSQGSAGATRS